MKKITFLIFLFSPLISFEQIDFGSASATARGGSVTATALNFEAIEINPANLGRKENDGFSLSVLNVGVNIQDNAINVNEIEHAKFDSLTYSDKVNMLKAATAPGGFNESTTVNWLAFSFFIPKVGGFGISLTDEIYSHVYLNSTAADVFFNGVNSQTYKDTAALANKLVSQEFNGSSAGGYQYREINIDYGRKLLTIKVHNTGNGRASFQNSEYLNNSCKTSDTVYNPIEIYGGIGLKPIWGIGDYNGMISNGQNIENGTYVYNSTYFSQLSSHPFMANGRGFGVDLGLNTTYEKWKFGMSAIDLGKINWQNNSFLNATITMPTLSSLEGEGGIFENGTDEFKIMSHFVNNVPNAGPNYTTDLPSKFRMGLSYQLTKIVAFSSDFVAPLNKVQGNLINPYWGVCTQLNFFNYFNLNVGFATEKGFGNLVPLGVLINFLQGPEIYAGTNDILAYLGNGNGHILSAAVGIRLVGF